MVNGGDNCAEVCTTRTENFTQYADGEPLAAPPPLGKPLANPARTQCRTLLAETSQRMPQEAPLGFPHARFGTHSKPNYPLTAGSRHARAEGNYPIMLHGSYTL